MENMRKKIEWLEKNDTPALIDLWDDYLQEILMDWSVFEMEDFDEAFNDVSPKEIMTFSNGNFNPNHKYYAYNEDITAYISFDTMVDYEPYMKRRDGFIKFLREEGYIL